MSTCTALPSGSSPGAYTEPAENARMDGNAPSDMKQNTTASIRTNVKYSTARHTMGDRRGKRGELVVEDV